PNGKAPAAPTRPRISSASNVGLVRGICGSLIWSNRAAKFDSRSRRNPLALPPARSRSLLAERANRVNPRGSQRWDQAREYRNRNEEQRCPRYAHRVGWTDMVQQRCDPRGRCQGEGEAGGDPQYSQQHAFSHDNPKHAPRVGPQRHADPDFPSPLAYRVSHNSIKTDSG